MNTEHSQPLFRIAISDLRALVERIENLIGAPPAQPTPISPKPSVGRGHARPIEAIDPATGAVAQRFASQHEAQESGFTQTSISRCVRGKAKQHGGYKWRFADAAHS